MNWLYFKIILVQASCFQLFLNLNYLEEKYWKISCLHFAVDTPTNTCLLERRPSHCLAHVVLLLSMPEHNNEYCSHGLSHHLDESMPHYSSNELLAFRGSIMENKRISQTLMNHIRALGINRIPATRRGVRAGRTKKRPQVDNQHHNRVAFGMLNARSVRNKTSEVLEFMDDNHLDILGICETWLNDDDSAVIGELPQNRYKLEHVPRPTRRGGGVGLL